MLSSRLVLILSFVAILGSPAAARADRSRADASDLDAEISLPELQRLASALEASDPRARRAAADAFIAFVKEQGAASRPEIARQIPKLGDRVTAALILATRDPARDVARWAAGELEVLGKRVPGDAVQTRSNDVLADVLEAYGVTHDADALSAVLSFVSSDRSQIREASRHAVLAYGDGALAKLREAFGNLTGNPPPQAWSSAEVAHELFTRNDRFRLQEVYAMMDAGLAAEAAGRHDEAVDAFERVLARQPLFERRAEMVPAFVSLAQSKEDTDRSAAAAYYRTASRLAPDGPRAGQALSGLDYLEGEDLLARGITDESLFRRASTADPGNLKAHAELARIEAERARRELSTRHYEEGAGAVAMLALGIVFLAGRRARSRT